MIRARLAVAAAIAGAALALAIVPPAFALLARSAAQLTPGPVCIGIIVANCSSQPARTSPLAFVAVLVLGAWGTIWMSRNAPADEDEEPEDEEGITQI